VAPAVSASRPPRGSLKRTHTCSNPAKSLRPCVVVDGRTYIWDVDRLVNLSRDFPVQKIRLSLIRELDECFWFGDEPATCRAVVLHAQLIEETDLIHPIILCSSGRVMDGMHRVCKALSRANAAVDSVQFTTDPQPDYVDADIDALRHDEP